MQFDPGASVLASDGQEVGTIRRIVIDPKTKKVTHVVVHTGVIMAQDKVVPADLFGVGDGGRPQIKLYANQLEQMPDFVETHFRPVNDEEWRRGETRATHTAPPALYWYPPYGEMPAGPIPPPVAKETKVNIPEGTVAVKQGAEVISADGQDLGSVDQVFTSPRTERVTHFLISKGRLLKEQKRVPIDWVDRLDEDKVRLAVGARTIEELPKYEQART